MVNDLIEISKVSKSFGTKKVLENVNISIKQGRSIALLGHNGCGKSTLLKIICGLTVIDSGKVTYSHKLKFNYVPENIPKMNITARQYINHIGLIEGVQVATLEKKSNELYHSFFVEEMIDTPMKHLSKGTLQKIGVIQALLTKPDVLLLDEPLSGQDIKSQRVFIQLVNKLNKEGVTIIMSCHEHFLVNMVSDTVYEIVNRNIKQVELSKDNKDAYDVLIFFKSDKNLGIPDDIGNLICKMENESDKVAMVANMEKSNLVIEKMIKNGYILRRMFSE